MPASFCLFCGGEGCAACYATATERLRMRDPLDEAHDFLRRLGVKKFGPVEVEIVMHAIQHGRDLERAAHFPKTAPKAGTKNRFAFIEFKEAV